MRRIIQWGIAGALVAATAAAQTSGIDFYNANIAAEQQRHIVRARAVQARPDIASPLNNLFSSHFYATASQVQQLAIELRVNAWPDDARPWNNPEWRRAIGISDAATFPVRVWRRRGDYVCPVQTLVVPMFPNAQLTLDVDTTQFRAGDWMYLEPSDAFVLSSLERNASDPTAAWTLITSLKTNGAYQWDAPRLTPPWGNNVPFIDCTKPDDER